MISKTRRKALQKLLENPNGVAAYRYLWDGLQPGRKIDPPPQGLKYWTARYWGLYYVSNDYTRRNLESEKMSDEDWKYIKSLISPPDGFLLDKENDAYITD